MPYQWKIGDLAQATVYRNVKLLVGIVEIFNHKRPLCRVSVMDGSCGADELTFPVQSLEVVSDDPTTNS
jgi:hypothetical protein